MNLTETLDGMRAAALEKYPANVIENIQRGTQELRESGISDGVLKVGSVMPSFELENTAGVAVDSADLVSAGPLIVSFYRGVW